MIYRQAAIDEALTFIVEYCGAAFDEDMQENLAQRLMLLPSAQPEPCDFCEHNGFGKICQYCHAKRRTDGSAEID